MKSSHVNPPVRFARADGKAPARFWFRKFSEVIRLIWGGRDSQALDVVRKGAAAWVCMNIGTTPRLHCGLVLWVVAESLPGVTIILGQIGRGAGA